MGKLLSLLSGFDPRTWLVYTVIALVLCITSFVGGCHYKEQSYAAKELKEAQSGARISNKDAASGATAAEKLTTKIAKGRETTASVLAETANRPLTVVQSSKCAPVSSKVSTVASKDPQPAQTTLTPKPEVTTSEDTQSCGPAYLTFSGIRLYDLSLGASGSGPVLPEGTNKETSTIQVDDAFRQVIAPNNQQCKEVTDQLNSLLDRIAEKQKLYAGKEVTVKD